MRKLEEGVYNLEMMKKIFTTLVLSAMVSIPVFFVSAAEITKLQNPIKYDTLSGFVAAVTQAAVNVLLPFLVLSFIYTGFLFVKAQGKDKEIGAAKDALWYSVIGALVLFGAWGFAQVIKTTVSTVTGISETSR